jgi:hypothetical protein
MGSAVECEGLTHEKYNVDEQLRKYVDDGGENTCLWYMPKSPSIG